MSNLVEAERLEEEQGDPLVETLVVVVPAPALERAGGQTDGSDDVMTVIVKAAEVVSRLEVLLRLYVQLARAGVGMSRIGSEGMDIVREHLGGPTGLWVLREEKERRVGGLKGVRATGDRDSRPESSADSEVNSDCAVIDTKCWRDIGVVKRLVEIRTETVKRELVTARMKLKSIIDSSVSRGVVVKSEIEEMKRVVQRKMWRHEHASKQRKLAHRKLVASLCQGHSDCREIDKLVEERTKGWDPRECLTPRLEQPTHNLVDVKMELRLRDVYMTRRQDIHQLTKEHRDVLDWARMSNREWSKARKEKWREDPGSRKDDYDQETEVMVYGDVDLSDEERDLLDKGPDFMVVGRLDEKEMRKETAVTLTKMRWSWRSKGQEGLTATERAQAEQETEEETEERDRLEAQQRDVIDDDGRAVDLRRLRATDMRNNRHVQMPGPSTVLVEAENNVRTGLWMREFLDFKQKEKREGVQYQGRPEQH